MIAPRWNRWCTKTKARIVEETKKWNETKYENTHEKTENADKHVFPRFYSSMSQFYGTSKAIHLHAHIHLFIRDRQAADKHTHTHILLLTQTINECVRTPFLVHLVSNQTLDEGLVTIETFAKVLHPENIPNAFVVLSILFSYFLLLCCSP